MIPQATKETIDNYVTHGWEPGGFVGAVLSNDLCGAFCCADQYNRAAMFDIVSYCYNEIPSEAWGSPGRVYKWLAKFAGENK